MQEPYSSKTLSGLSGSNPLGANASLLDLIHGKSVSFNASGEKAVIFLIFKPNLFVYLKHVGLSSLSKSNVKRLRIDYLDDNQLLIRTFFLDYPTEKTSLEPMDDVNAVKITIEETFDGRPAENVRLTVRGCFGIQLSTTTSAPSRPAISTTTPSKMKKSSSSLIASLLAPCHHLNLMNNRSIAHRVIAHIAGTQPKSASLFDYFNTSTLISYAEARPKFIVVFKSNIYVELKAISIASDESNVRTYQIDLIDFDQTVLQTIVIDRQQTQSVPEYDAPIGAVQITYLETTDGQAPRNILLNVDGCFGLKLSPSVDESTTTTPQPVDFTTSLAHCHEIDLMNKVDSSIFVDSITGTLPSKATNKLTDYFNETSVVSYDQQGVSNTFVILFKRTIAAEIQSIALISPSTNVRRFRVDLIDDYKSIVQTVESNENLTATGLTAVGIAALQITYLETKDQQAPKNIRLSVRGCFEILSADRRTTTVGTTAEPSTATKSPRTTKKAKRN